VAGANEVRRERVEQVLAERAGRARRNEWRRNLKALVTAVLMIALAVLFYARGSFIFGISEKGLQASMAGLFNQGGHCGSAGDRRWVCAMTDFPSPSDGPITEYYAVRETSRGCWEARAIGSPRPSPRAFEAAGTRRATRSGCLRLIDYFTGEDSGFGHQRA
jgi:hypothetical protein